MNIETIGDLLRTTESDLLSYKNFGETSLQEIKKILESKGLRLGMALEDKAAAPGETAIAQGASQELLAKSAEDLELSVRARALTRLNVKTILDLINKTEAELLGCKNFGVTSLNEIKDKLSQFGLSLRKLDKVELAGPKQITLRTDKRSTTIQPAANRKKRLWACLVCLGLLTGCASARRRP